MFWKVLITARAIMQVGQPAIQLMREAGCEMTVPPEFGPFRGAALEQKFDGFDAVLATVDQYNEAIIKSPAAQRLKIISRWGVGYDSIDIGAATQAGIVVAYTPGILNETVADLTFALILSVARHVAEGHAIVLKGEWRQSWGRDVFGKTLGIVGCGRIGQAVARRASGFNMPLLGYDVAPQPEAEKLGVKFVSLERLLAESDFVSLHASMIPQNRGMIGEAQFRLMKPSAYFINAARGALVDEAALARALHESWIGGAALDTFAVEPLPADHPLRQAPNVLFSPHQASFARETGERVSVMAAQAIVEAMNGRRPQFVVNPEVFKSPTLRMTLLS